MLFFLPFSCFSVKILILFRTFQSFDNFQRFFDLHIARRVIRQLHLDIRRNADLVDVVSERRVIMGNRQFHHAAVRELECILDNAFSECRRSDNRSDAVIFDCSREDFCRTCRIFIDQHDEWNRDRGIAVAGILFPFSVFILGIYDESLR